MGWAFFPSRTVFTREWSPRNNLFQLNREDEVNSFILFFFLGSGHLPVKALSFLCCKRGDFVLIHHRLMRFDGLFHCVPIAQDTAHPCYPVFHFLEAAGSAPFVYPVSSNPILRNFLHRERAYLHFHVFSLRTDYCGVNRLVTVVLGTGDIVLKAFGERPITMRENIVGSETLARIFGLKDDTDSIEIVYFFERLVARDHLVEDAVEMLGSAFDGIFEVQFREERINRLYEGSYVRLACFS